MASLADYDWVSLMIEAILIFLGIAILKEVRRLYTIESKYSAILEKQELLAQNIDNLYDLGELYEELAKVTLKEEQEDKNRTFQNLNSWLEQIRVYLNLPMTTVIPQGKSTNIHQAKLSDMYRKRHEAIIAIKEKFKKEKG